MERASVDRVSFQTMLLRKVRQEINSILNAFNVSLGNATEKSRADVGAEVVCIFRQNNRDNVLLRAV